MQLSAAEKSRCQMTKKAHKEILDKMGMQYTCLNEVPGWLPVSQSLLDYVHNFYGMLFHRFTFHTNLFAQELWEISSPRFSLMVIF